MTRHFVFRIGPIDMAGEEAYAYYVQPGRENEDIFFAGDDVTALGDITAAYRPIELEAEPLLTAAAEAVGVATSGYDPARSGALFLAALSMAVPDLFLDSDDHQPLLAFGQAAALFWRAEPWRIPSVRRLRIEFESPSPERFEGRTLGSAGESYGLALYPGEGALARMEALASADRVDEAAALTSLGIRFESEPAYVADAVERAYALPRIPIPLKIRDGEAARPDPRDIARLAAALIAVAALAVSGDEGRGSARGNSFEISAVARPL